MRVCFATALVTYLKETWRRKQNVGGGGAAAAAHSSTRDCMSIERLNSVSTQESFSLVDKERSRRGRKNL